CLSMSSAPRTAAVTSGQSRRTDGDVVSVLLDRLDDCIAELGAWQLAMDVDADIDSHCNWLVPQPCQRPLQVEQPVSVYPGRDVGGPDHINGSRPWPSTCRDLGATRRRLGACSGARLRCAGVGALGRLRLRLASEDLGGVVGPDECCVVG